MMHNLIYPVFLPQAACPGTCIYCDQKVISGQAQTQDIEQFLPAVAEFIRRNPGQEKQIAFYGGSFTAIPLQDRDRLLAQLETLLDDNTSLRISTHPLYIDEEVLDWAEKHRIKTIELGIQDFSTEVLSCSGRAYDGQQAIEACRMVQERGIELGVQLMPGLPGWTQASLDYNRDCLRLLKPNLLRLYPLIVIEGTALASLWKDKKYQALSLDQAIAQGVDYLELCEAEGISLIKLGLPSNLDAAKVLAGPWHPAFGEFVKAERLIRKIALDYSPGQAIILERKQVSLLMGHKRRYLRLLEDRLKTCNLLIECR